MCPEFLTQTLASPVQGSGVCWPCHWYRCERSYRERRNSKSNTEISRWQEKLFRGEQKTILISKHHMTTGAWLRMYQHLHLIMGRQTPKKRGKYTRRPRSTLYQFKLADCLYLPLITRGLFHRALFVFIVPLLRSICFSLLSYDHNIWTSGVQQSPALNCYKFPRMW